MATMRLRSFLLLTLLASNLNLNLVFGQLPDDIQRELNQNLAEQARIQAMRQRHQQQIQSRTGAAPSGSSAAPGTTHDPNNYSYQQVSPPIQYSYYQPFGDAAGNNRPQQQQPNQPQQAAAQKIPADAFDLNNLNFELPKPQAQVAAQAPPQPQLQQQHLTPSFTGPGGLPVLQPMAAAQVSGPQSSNNQVQQGPPLTEADFKDITGGENYGAPAGSQAGAGDFGLGDAPASPSQRRQDADTDAQLREFGFPGSSQPQQQQQRQPQLSNQMGPVNMADFGLDDATRPQQQQQPPRRQDLADEFGLGSSGSGTGSEGFGGAPSNSQRPPTDFDFAIQPSASQQGATSGGGAPGSLQSLLGSGFPGLSGGGNGGLDGFASGSNDPQRPQTQKQADDGSLEVADLGDRADGFSGADLGQFEQPTPKNDYDFNYAAANNQQPSVVPYPDGAPQPVGTLLALTQPQSLTQTRYSPLPDKGTFQNYPAYQILGSSPQMSWQVRSVVARTPRARRPGPGRYGQPAPSALAPEFRTSGGHFNYARGPLGASGYE